MQDLRVEGNRACRFGSWHTLRVELVVFWLICAVIAAAIASSKGRSGFGWFLLGCLFSVVAVLLSETRAA